jgi:hypothetical protein
MSHPDMPERTSEYGVPRDAAERHEAIKARLKAITDLSESEVVAAMREELANPKPGSVIEKLAEIHRAIHEPGSLPEKRLLTMCPQCKLIFNARDNPLR